MHVVNILTPDNPYGDQIRNFFQTEFPYQMDRSNSDLLELLTNVILATGKVRLGPKPSIESQFAIRQTIAASVEAGLPIRFLMPWGSQKPKLYQTVDLAEVAALKTVTCLFNRVHELYEPGIDIRIRVEDATAPSLYYDQKDQKRLSARAYLDSFTKLNAVLGTDSFVRIVPESSMVTEEAFEEELNKHVPAFEKYLSETTGTPDEELQANLGGYEPYEYMTQIGWSGIIPQAQRQHYLSTYRKLYPEASDQANIHRLAIYMAQAISRRRLNMMGDTLYGQSWRDYLGLSFVGPIPGEPKGHAPKRIYYRTMPENLSGNHIVPWRAKGYFSIGDGIPRVRLSSWSEPKQYHEAEVTLDNGETSVAVRTDYEVL